MFLLNDKPLALDCAFTTEDGTQFPANWLRLTSPEERAAIGITEVPDPVSAYDQRFYWGPDLPKDHAQLVEQWVAQVKQTAGSLLSQTDWYITRASETGVNAPQSVLSRRAEVRTLSNEKEAVLEATASTDELAAYVTGSEFNVWEPVVTESTVEVPVIDGFTSGTAITGSGILGGSGEDILSF